MWFEPLYGVIFNNLLQDPASSIYPNGDSNDPAEIMATDLSTMIYSVAAPRQSATEDAAVQVPLFSEKFSFFLAKPLNTQTDQKIHQKFTFCRDT